MGLVLKLVPFFLLIVLFFFFSDSIEKYINSETDDSFFLGSKEKFIASLFWMALIAPIYEELIFDGAFLKNKIYKWISYLGLFVKETELLHYENKHINVEYNEAPNFQPEIVDLKNDSIWVLQSSKVESLLKMRFANSDSILNLYNAKSGRYDLNIRFKNGPNNNQVLKFLIQDSLLIKK